MHENGLPWMRCELRIQRQQLLSWREEEEDDDDEEDEKEDEKEAAGGEGEGGGSDEGEQTQRGTSGRGLV